MIQNRSGQNEDMNTFEIRIRKEKSEGHGVYHSIHFTIDGRDLIELVGEYEDRFSILDAGDYAGLPAEHYPKMHFLGHRSHPIPDDDGRFKLLDHPCGIAGCWPIETRIELGSDTVIWKNFQQPHRTGELETEVWDYSDFGPFEFDRTQYEEELTKIERDTHEVEVSGTGTSKRDRNVSF